MTMRAKEYIAMNISSIKYYEEIVRVVAELLTIRTDKYATDQYFNDYLYADWRKEQYEKAMKIYRLDNTVDKPVLNHTDGEIPADIAFEFRSQLFDVLKGDASYGYAFYQLAMEKNRINSMYQSKPIQCVPDEAAIKTAINSFRDDYPKTSLDEFLDDEFNYGYYDLLSSSQCASTTEAMLNFFNNAYALYDELRCIKSKVTQVKQHIGAMTFNSEEEKRLLLDYVANLIETTNLNDKALARCKNEIEKFITSPSDRIIAKPTVPVYLKKTPKGAKVNLIRIVNVLHEMGLFVDKDGNKASKIDTFAAIGYALNTNLSSFQNDLSTGNAATDRDKTSVLKIFKEMLSRQEQILDKE